MIRVQVPVVVMMMMVVMEKISPPTTATWLYYKERGEGKEGSCFPSQESQGKSVTCKGSNITAVPGNMPRNITQLNLSNTRVAALPPGAFANYPLLQELYIRNSTELTVIHKNAFSGLQQLRILVIIDCMKLTTIGEGVFRTFQNLHTLRIVKSGLISLPDFSSFETKSPSHNKNMYEIDLTTNRIRRISKGAFSGVRTWLLRLENNMLQEIEDFAFKGSQIFNLDFQNNPDLHSVGDYAFSGITDLQSLNLSRTSIWRLPTAGLINIRELNVQEVPTLKQFPSVLEFSHIEVARLTYPHHCCAFQHPDKQDPAEYLDYEHQQQQLRLKQQHLHVDSCAGGGGGSSGRGVGSTFSEGRVSTTPTTMRTSLDVDELGYRTGKTAPPHNAGFKRHIPTDDYHYHHHPHDASPDLRHPSSHPHGSWDFNTGSTGKPDPEDPASGKISSGDPVPDSVVPNSWSTHSQHSWSAQDLGDPQAGSSANFEDGDRKEPFSGGASFPQPRVGDGFGHFGAHVPGTTQPPPQLSSGDGVGVGDTDGGGGGAFGHFGHRFNKIKPDADQPHVKDADIIWRDKPANESHVQHSCTNFTRHKDYASVVCTPVPNAFNPCEDVMGYEWLRVTVWFVLLATLCGNAVVIVVLVSGRNKMTVPKFLMLNLSVADLLMGLYLLLLASIDAHSLGQYFTHAVSWQNDGGCQVAGFLTVFSSELSVFVLMVITLERWYAISYAIHITKRLRIRQAWALMLTGWLYASTMALLPLVGVSGYGAVSMCLPMEARDVWDKVYIVALLVLNGLAFLVICCCYISMFSKVRSSDAMARSNDATVAKRMSILVLTNFVCWAPIAFFGLTASFGFPLIDISNSKILLVFFYPLNSCANPFLYVILTKQFRKDIFILLGRYGICTKRANQYKRTYTYKSHSHSKQNGMLMLHNTHRMSDMSTMSRLSIKSSRGSFNGVTPKMTPQTTPQSTPHGSPKSSPLRRLIGVAASALMSHTNGGTGGGGGGWSGVALSENGAKTSGKERKLSVVPETSQNSDDGNGAHDERVLEARDSLRDLFDGKPHGRVRSASEYVVLYQNRDKAGEQPPRDLSREGRRRSSRFLFERQPSLDNSISSATETSYVSDSSWARLDSFGSGQSQGQDSDCPGAARMTAVAAAKRARASHDGGCGTPPLSPTVALMRMRFLPTRAHISSDGESPTRPLPHAQLTRLLYNRSVSQESSGTDDDLLDEESKVRKSLL